MCVSVCCKERGRVAIQASKWMKALHIEVDLTSVEITQFFVPLFSVIGIFFLEWMFFYNMILMFVV